MQEARRRAARRRRCARLPGPVRRRPLVPLDRGSDRRGPAARRELPEPRRLRHPGARRHRRVERHARLRPAEDPQRRDPQVRRRDDAAGAGGLRAAGRVPRARGQPAGRRAGARPASRRFRRTHRRGARRVVLCADGVGRVAGVGVGLLVSLLFSLVPLLEVRRVKPLLLLRGGTTAGRAGRLSRVVDGRGGARAARAHRLDAGRRRGAGRRGARRRRRRGRRPRCASG